MAVMRLRAQVFSRWVLTAGLGCACGVSWGLSIGTTYGADVFFSPQSAGIEKLQWRQIEYATCRVGQIDLQAVIVTGHANSGEVNPQKLSEERALVVKRRMIEQGVPEDRVYAEGKADRQPEDALKLDGNRRVTIEIIGTGGRSRSPCNPLWVQHMLGLPLQQALSAARAQVRDGWALPHEPALEAVRARRSDLLALLLSKKANLPPSQRGRQELISAAALTGETALIDVLQRSGLSGKNLATVGEALTEAVCGRYHQGIHARLTDDQALIMVKRLLDFGGRHLHSAAPEFSPSLACAAGRGNDALVDALLGAGADPNSPPESPAFLSVGKNSAITRKLVASGANPRLRTSLGKTLLDSYRITTLDDVQWITNIGLNVGARSEDGDTPLRRSLEYASVEVLDALEAAGAHLDKDVQTPWLLNTALSNPPALAWLIRKGVSLGSQPNLLQVSAAMGDVGLPAVRALIERGVDLERRADFGKTAVSSAIDAFAVKTLSVLIDSGAKVTANDLAAAKRLLVRLSATGCADCSLAWYVNLSRELNSQDNLAQRQIAKDEMIQILQARIAR
jgi:ankyrin repeat protein